MVVIEAVENGVLKKSGEFDEHKRVVKITDADSGLYGYIAIHNDNLGSAVGGTRMVPYETPEDALDDVLRLSRAMSYKCALVGVPHGGGKGVLIGDPSKDKTDALLRAYAKAISKLNGIFYTGEDVGMAEADVHLMLNEAPFFIGKPGQAGDPSPFAALSTFYSIQTIAEIVFGSADLHNRTVAIKGVGKVGSELVRLLAEQDAKLVIADVNRDAVRRVISKFPSVQVVRPEEIHKQVVDIYSPCALGHEFTPQTMLQIKAKIICGAANNQLADQSVGDWFFAQNIHYVPDYIANSGGLIDVVDELEPGGFNSARVIQRIEKVKDTVRGVFKMAQVSNQPPNRVADLLAEDLFKK